MQRLVDRSARALGGSGHGRRRLGSSDRRLRWHRPAGRLLREPSRDERRRSPARPPRAPVRAPRSARTSSTPRCRWSAGDGRSARCGSPRASMRSTREVRNDALALVGVGAAALVLGLVRRLASRRVPLPPAGLAGRHRPPGRRRRPGRARARDRARASSARSPEAFNEMAAHGCRRRSRPSETSSPTRPISCARR